MQNCLHIVNIKDYNFLFARMARHYTALILDDKSILNKPILVTVWSKDTAKLAAEPTQHNSLDSLHTRSKNQPLHCL